MTSGARGIVLVTVLIMLAMMSALTMLLTMNLMQDARASEVLQRNSQLFYAADAGVEEACAPSVWICFGAAEPNFNANRRLGRVHPK
jgi:Tfp pilus assembly protein PilX